MGLVEYRTGVSTSANEKVPPSPETLAAFKKLQRSDPEAKMLWEAYCEKSGQGVKDPDHHDASFVEHFMSKYLNGDDSELVGPVDDPSAKRRKCEGSTMDGNSPKEEL